MIWFPSRLREGLGVGMALFFEVHNARSARPTPAPSRKREGRV